MNGKFLSLFEIPTFKYIRLFGLPKSIKEEREEDRKAIRSDVEKARAKQKTCS